MVPTYSIGELAASAGVPVSTVRYYEREGLLAPDGRTEARYRVYGAASLRRLRFIRAAQAIGLALADVRTLLALRDRDEAPCGDVRRVLEMRLDDVEARLVALRRVRAELSAALARCREEDAAAPCHVVHRIERDAGA